MRFAYNLAIAILMVLSAPVWGQKDTFLTREQLDSIMNPTPLSNGDQILEFHSKEYNIGDIYQSESPRPCIFTYKNVGGSDIKITNIKTTCGCTAADYNEEQIILTYSPKGNRGKIDVQAYVYTTASATAPTAILHISGNVINNDKWDYLPYSIGDLRIKRKRVSFNEVKRHQNPSMAILCANSGDKDITLTARNLPDYAEFKSVPETLPADTEGELILTIDGDKLPQNSNQPLYFTFTIDGVEAQIIEKTIKVTIEKID